MKLDPELPEGVDERLWIRLHGKDERLFLLGASHTFPGRMSVWEPSKDRGVSVSKHEIVEMSDEARWWVTGFLVGNEPRPPKDESANKGYWEANEVYRRTGAWPSSYGLDRLPADETLLALVSLGPLELVDEAFIESERSDTAKAVLAARLDGQKVWYPVSLELEPWPDEGVRVALEETIARIERLGVLDLRIASALAETRDPRVRDLLRAKVMAAFDVGETRSCISLMTVLIEHWREPWQGIARLMASEWDGVSRLARRFELDSETQGAS